MALTNGQKKALHMAAASARIQCDEDRRKIQSFVGGFRSAADPTASREGFVAVMAYYERLCGGALAGYTKGYWSAAEKTGGALDRLAYKARGLAKSIGMSPAQLDELVAGPNMTAGLYAGVGELNEAWLSKLIEALKAIQRRKASLAGTRN